MYLRTFLHRRHHRRHFDFRVHGHYHCFHRDNQCAHLALCKCIWPAYLILRAMIYFAMVSRYLPRVHFPASAKNWWQEEKEKKKIKWMKGTRNKATKQNQSENTFVWRALMWRELTYSSVIYSTPAFIWIWLIFMVTFSNFFTNPCSGATNGPMITILNVLAVETLSK